ncbi:MAG: hypothetical protein NXI24_18305 [bacterium]|nr:hypothetical protein [bacterium]
MRRFTILAAALALIQFSGCTFDVRFKKSYWPNTTQPVPKNGGLRDVDAGKIHVAPGMMKEIATKDNRVLDFGDLLKVDKVFADVRQSRQASRDRQSITQTAVRVRLLAPIVESISEEQSGESSRDLVERLTKKINRTRELSGSQKSVLNQVLSEAVSSTLEQTRNGNQSTKIDLSTDAFSEESRSEKETLKRNIERKLGDLESTLQAGLQSRAASADGLNAPYYQALEATANTVLGGRVLENLYNVKKLPPGFKLYTVPVVVSFSPGRITRKNYTGRAKLELDLPDRSADQDHNLRIIAVAPGGFSSMIADTYSRLARVGLDLGAALPTQGFVSGQAQVEKMREDLEAIARVVNRRDFQVNIADSNQLEFRYLGHGSFDKDIYLQEVSFVVEALVLARPGALETNRPASSTYSFISGIVPDNRPDKTLRQTQQAVLLDTYVSATGSSRTQSDLVDAGVAKLLTDPGAAASTNSTKKIEQYNQLAWTLASEFDLHRANAPVKKDERPSPALLKGLADSLFLPNKGTGLFDAQTTDQAEKNINVKIAASRLLGAIIAAGYKMPRAGSANRASLNTIYTQMQLVRDASTADAAQYRDLLIEILALHGAEAAFAAPAIVQACCDGNYPADEVRIQSAIVRLGPEALGPILSLRDRAGKRMQLAKVIAGLSNLLNFRSIDYQVSGAYEPVHQYAEESEVVCVLGVCEICQPRASTDTSSCLQCAQCNDCEQLCEEQTREGTLFVYTLPEPKMQFVSARPIGKKKLLIQGRGFRKYGLAAENLRVYSPSGHCDKGPGGDGVSIGENYITVDCKSEIGRPDVFRVYVDNQNTIESYAELAYNPPASVASISYRMLSGEGTFNLDSVTVALGIQKQADHEITEILIEGKSCTPQGCTDTGSTIAYVETGNKMFVQLQVTHQMSLYKKLTEKLALVTIKLKDADGKERLQTDRVLLKKKN